MTAKESENSSDEKIKIFSSNDEKLKVLGELLSNKSSRDIIKLLINNEMYANEISQKLNLRPNLVIHHLKKLESIGLVEINEKRLTKKGSMHKFFNINSNFLIIPDKNDQEIKEKRILNRFFKNGVRFVAIGIAAMVPWIVTEDGLLSQLIETERTHTGAISIDQPEYDFFQSLSEIDPIVFSPFFIAAGLVLERMFSYMLKKRKKQHQIQN